MKPNCKICTNFAEHSFENAGTGVSTLQKIETAGELRRALTAGFLAGVLVFFLPVLLMAGQERAGAETELLPASPSPVSERTESTGTADAQRTVRVLLEDDTVEEQTMADYLWCVVAAEMPASFEPDALRAQAVCARTYTLWKTERSQKHENADICTDSACCQAYTTRAAAQSRWGDEASAYEEKIAQAVSDTDGIVAVYDGAVIQAVFFSSAAGRTEDAAAVWGNALPYLSSVDSPEGADVPNYTTEVTFTPEEARALILAAYPEADLSGSPEGWFRNVSHTASGRVAELDVGGVTLSGGAARTLFSLRSAAFTVAADGAGVTFSVTGYGHGVGMSQYGANAMAKAGSTWEDILRHYYTGISLTQI